MHSIDQLGAGTAPGIYMVTTSNGSTYTVVFSRGQRLVKRSPAPGAEPLWLDEGGPVHQLECAIGQPLRAYHSGGYTDSDLTLRAGVVESIVRLPDATEVDWVQ